MRVGSGPGARGSLQQWTDEPTCPCHTNTGQAAVQLAGQQWAGTHVTGGKLRELDIK